jgi:hypothetical protein
MSIHACKSCSLSVLNFITHPPACSIFILLRGPPGTLPLPFGAKVRRMGNRKSAFQAEIEGETRRSRKTFTSPHDDGAADGPCNGSTFHFASSLVRLMVVLGACGIIVCFRSYTRREHTKKRRKGKGKCFSSADFGDSEKNCLWEEREMEANKVSSCLCWSVLHYFLETFCRHSTHSRCKSSAICEVSSSHARSAGFAVPENILLLFQFIR